MKMTNNETIRVLIHHQEYIHYDEELGICSRPKLVDAIVRAVRALREGKEQETPTTNADRIRAMSDEELAVFLEKSTGGCETCATVCACNGPEDLPPKSVCHQGVLQWLQQPAKED